MGLGAQLDLSRVRLQNNSGIYGGAIRLADATANLTQIEMLDNDAGRLGGGISALDTNLKLLVGRALPKIRSVSPSILYCVSLRRRPRQ